MKNAVIFGDSYSTFEGFIPEGYDTYYPDTDTGVTSVTQTWWYQLMEEAGLNLILNDSWSGSTIGYLGYNDSDCSKTSSFIPRLNKFIQNGFFKNNKIDTVFVFGGTNDSWIKSPLGTLKYDNFENQDFYSVLPAISYFLKTLKNTLPDAEIYCLINTGLKTEISDCFEKSCEKYNITKITFDAIDKINGHPSVKGMQEIKNTVLNVITK